MDILKIIRDKRDNLKLSNEEIKYFIKNYVSGDIKDYQASALLMAIYINDIDNTEATNLAIAMRDSGKCYDLSKINGYKVDKHSTGGVGDKVTLFLAPVMACLGLKFAKMSGRGLGHTGGTLDKLESIKGFNINLDEDEFIKQVNEIGIAVIGQSENITPADKKLYSLRDVTETVSNIGLIASSIMSKKLASGSDIIILDVKYGNGAFMKDVKSATKLASLMVKIGTNAGKKVEAIITNMNEPLGHMIGNRLEVYEVIKSLKGSCPSDLLNVCLTIGCEQLILSNPEIKIEKARKMILDVIKSGKALDKFYEFIKHQGGILDDILDEEKLLHNKFYDLKAKKDGFISKMNSENIGNAARILGAGRLKKEDVIDYNVGIRLDKKIGDKVKIGDTILRIYHNDKGLDEAVKILEESIIISKKYKKDKLIAKIVKW